MPHGSLSMGPPPLSPRETRRSGRRSAPSVSASASKSPDSDQPPTKERSNTSRTANASTNNRNKKLKQEDYDEATDDRKHTSASSASSGVNNGNGKGKRKAKDKHEKQSNNEEPEVIVEDPPHDPVEDEEEQGITRCVCGSSEDDPDAGEFMVQCETCKVWQHGLCMGYQSEEQVHDDDYYCEICRPELHAELLKKLSRRPRQASAASRQENTSSRVSRSHSPSQFKVPASKRRNTMNSRDAAFDESLKEIIEATAAEAAAAENANTTEVGQAEPVDKNKKRKRSEDDTTAKKRTRSASIASDRQSAITISYDPPPAEKPAAQAAKGPTGRNKRGGRKANTTDIPVNEPEEASVAPPAKKPANNPRARATTNVKKPPNAQSTPAGITGIDTTTQRRNQTGGSGANSAAEARAYRQTHAYAVSQQTLYTSWNLPDYLSHLEQLLPSDTPQPLEVRAGASSARGESTERTMERGVKVKWPAKRMSVADMNKRVRALVEWVGREQASALDRGRRREALEKSLRDQTEAAKMMEDGEEVQMVDGNETAEQQNQLCASAAEFSRQAMTDSALEMSARTMKMMEELMEELIRFQERFGPGAKSRERERRVTAVA